jgi:PAT family beta-lactamase induction signal transducer AmpG
MRRPAEGKGAHPLLWVPSLYFAMGTPMIAVSMVAAIMYKNLGLSNADIALYTGSMYLPWVVKPLWAPVVELLRTKRFFVLLMEWTMAITFTCLAMALRLPSYLALTIALFWITGFASATQDIAGDGVYISALAPRQQALFGGVQGMAWNIGKLLASGALVTITGFLHDRSGLSWMGAWSLVMLVFAAIMAGAAGWHLAVLPTGDRATHEAKHLGEAFSTMGDAWASFFRKRDIWLMIAVVFFYRFGEGFIEKMGPLFMMDPRSVGGLGLSNTTLGNINGSVGTIGFIGGTLLGGLIAARFGLRRVFLPLALALNIPHLTYFYLSQALPESLSVITAVVTIEKIGYGFGTIGLMLYMMQQLAPGPYRTAHYAFATGIMALNMMATGMVSGHIQEALGHRGFFIFVLAASVPPIVLAKLAPFHHSDAVAKPEAQAANA